MPSQTFSAQAGYQKFNVPKGVDRITVDVQGGSSGTSTGGRVQGTIKVKGDDVLYLLVGKAGSAASGAQGGAGGTGGGRAGGDGSGGRNGGRGGAGASAIRMNAADGTIKVVAGGAGGKSGDNGDGGNGGGSLGGHGSLGTTGSGGVGNATGGSQSQGGKGGHSTGAGSLDGEDGENGNLGRAGRGGQRIALDTHGGGGGGGGYKAGGGGAAALVGATPGGGGGGGSSFVGAMTTVTMNSQGGAAGGDGSITLTWNEPPPANQPPNIPSDVKVDGKAESSGMSTKSTGRVDITAVIRDPDRNENEPDHSGDPTTFSSRKVRLLIRYSTSSAFNHVASQRSPYVDSGKRAETTLTGLEHNTRYYLRLYAEDKQGKLSSGYKSVNFWTNRDPREPLLQSPSDNGVILDTDTITFDWAFKDPDDNDKPSGFRIRWRRAARGASSKPGDWVVKERTGTQADTFAVDPTNFRAGEYYEWTVRTRDDQKAWGPWAAPRSFYVLGTTSPPQLTAPVNGHSVDATEPVLHTWKFRDPTPGEAQIRADLRFRLFTNTDDIGWTTLLGDLETPGGSPFYEVPAGTYVPGMFYEWQVRTYNTSDPLPSDWSDSAFFWARVAIGTPDTLTPTLTEAHTVLGCGTHRAFIYDRGGQVLRGEISPLSSVTWSRVRDEMGEAKIVTNGFGDDCGRLLAGVHTWINELVIFRDGERVFEGPITLIEDETSGFSIQAKDVLGYLYRRIAQQGYNDSYHVVNGVEEGLLSVVERATLIFADALARNDPNVLAHITPYNYPDDARQARTLGDFEKTAYEEVDDMAANSGLDYSVIGRRIILNDTHRPIGRLPEMRNEHFSQAPKISEYGMLLADLYAVTNNAGLYGSAHHDDSPYGGVELLVSSFSEVGAADGETMTRKQQEAVRQVLTTQALRGIASRYPAPYVVRVPDNTQLLPEAPVGINQLVPGVWIPLRVTGTVIEIAQWQKLDQVQVTETSAGEQVAVTMSPAPNRGEDPDAEGAAEEAAT